MAKATHRSAEMSTLHRKGTLQSLTNCTEDIRRSRDLRSYYPAKRLCCTNGEMDSLFESSGVATVHEQLVPYEVQDQELAFVQHGAEAARFAINLV